MQKKQNRKQKLGDEGRGTEGRAGANMFILQSGEPKYTTMVNGKLNKNILTVHGHCTATVLK